MNIKLFLRDYYLYFYNCDMKVIKLEILDEIVCNLWVKVNKKIFSINDMFLL